MMTRDRSSLDGLMPTALEVDSVSMFGALDPEQLVQLWGYLNARHCEPGERVFQQGDMPSEIFILVSGNVDFIVDKNGNSRLETSYHEGDTFGDSAFIGIQPQMGSAIVSGVEVAELLVLTRGALMKIYEENLSLFGVLVMNLGREVSRKYHRHIEEVQER